MPAEDVLLGVAISGNDTTRTYTAYRIDYNDERPISEFVDTEQFDVSVKNPPAGYPGHEAKGNYQRKVLIGEDSEDSSSASESARDAITQTFDDGIETEIEQDDGTTEMEVVTVGYEVEEINPDDRERQAVEEYGAMNSLEAHDAERWAQAIEDLEAGEIDPSDFNRGRNPHRGYEFGGPSNRGRGREKAKQAGPPDHASRPDKPRPVGPPGQNK